MASLGSLLPPPSSVSDRSLCFSFEPSLQSEEDEKLRLLSFQGYSRVDVASGRGKHSVVCRHWLRGMCMKGDFCDFLHQLDYSRVPACRSLTAHRYCAELQRGYCPYKHILGGGEEEDGGGVMGGGGPYGIVVKGSAADECPNYFWGYCPLGGKCKRRHKKRGEAPPSVVPDWYLHVVLKNPQVFPPATEQILRQIELLEEKLLKPDGGGLERAPTLDDGGGRGEGGWIGERRGDI